MTGRGATDKMFGGGGIYVNGLSQSLQAVLNLKNALITDNEAAIAGGGYASCPVSTTNIFEKDGIATRVVSMPCMDVFETQSKEYKEEVLPKTVRNRVAIEALSSFGWDRYTGLDGRVISMNSFGASAPQDLLFKKFGFTKENVVTTAKEVFNQ